MIRAGEFSGLEGRMGLAPHGVFLGTSALLFIASAAMTIYLCQSMSGGMALPGGWTMSMAWMKMQGQNWLASAASFMGMWAVMMAAMMLPPLVPTLLRYRLSLRGPETIHLSALTVIAGAGYFFVWALLGVVVYGAVIMTSNIGNGLANDHPVGFAHTDGVEAAPEDATRNAVTGHFPREFIGRMGDVVIFRPLANQSTGCIWDREARI